MRSASPKLACDWKVASPLTFKVCSTNNFLLIPTPQRTCNAPLVGPVESVVLCNLVIPQAFRFLPIPTPPLTTNAPVVQLVDSVILLNIVDLIIGKNIYSSKR